MLRSIEYIAKTGKMALVIPIVSIMVFSLSAVPVSADKTRTFIAVINSGQEDFPSASTDAVTPPMSNAGGGAFMIFDKETSELCYTISFSPLMGGSETAAHFHGPAAAGEGAGILFDISPGPSDGGPGPSDLGSPKTGCVGPLTEDHEKDLKKGLFYINIHSDIYPMGEIRGQVLPIKGAK